MSDFSQYHLTTKMGVLKFLTFALLLLFLSACGSDKQEQAIVIEPEPTISVISLANVDEVQAAITSAQVSQGELAIAFQLVDENGVGIIDLSSSDIRFTVAKLGASAVGNLTGNWQSYINIIEQPGVGPGTLPKLQATSESGGTGVLTNNLDGTYAYTFSQNLDMLAQEILAQADVEGLDLRFITSNTHRVALQISNAENPVNSTFDWIPETGKTQYDGIFSHNMVATQTCNTCHGNLAMHGGGRVEVKYCVTCHNPGSTDANSGNTVNFKNMIHKIHRGKELPSVKSGGVYQIYGYRDSIHDYSNVGYPKDITQCSDCHAGNASASEDQIITISGDNWREVATMTACGSCHDELDFASHYGGQQNDENCMSCHQNSGIAGSIENKHKNLVAEASNAYQANIISITDTQAGQNPQVQFSITDPTNNDQTYDILNDADWTQANGASRLAVDIGWSTVDYTNTGNQGTNASAVEIDALANAQPVGDGTFIVTSPIAIPDGTLAPNIPATGSGAVNIEGHPAKNLASDEDNVQVIPMTNTVDYFSIDEASGMASSRREVVSLNNCLTCHGKLSLHGNNRTDNIESCVVCHNARNTDKRVRDIALTPPTDGKVEESIDFKTMIHAIHASSKRSQPLQVVGFGGYSTHVYDQETIHYPNDIGNCLSCHIEGTFTLPLNDGVLASTVSTGSSIADPSDDIVISPMAAVCSSCHDDSSEKSHMESNGANFQTSQEDIDNGVVIEQCSLCHGSGKPYDVEAVHPLLDPE